MAARSCEAEGRFDWADVDSCVAVALTNPLSEFPDMLLTVVPELVVLAAGVVCAAVVSTLSGCVAVPKLVVLAAGVVGDTVVSALPGCFVLT